MLNIDEEERAAEAISRILMYGNKAEPDKEVTATVPTGGETPSDETTLEVPPSEGGEETPPTEEEVPETVPA
jgi:hypothetical protein